MRTLRSDYARRKTSQGEVLVEGLERIQTQTVHVICTKDLEGGQNSRQSGKLRLILTSQQGHIWFLGGTSSKHVLPSELKLCTGELGFTAVVSAEGF